MLPPLGERAAELDRIIDEYAADAVAALGASATFTPADRDWVRRHEAATLAGIEKATRRLVAIRGNGGSITRAAARDVARRPLRVGRAAHPAGVSRGRGARRVERDHRSAAR